MNLLSPLLNLDSPNLLIDPLAEVTLQQAQLEWQALVGFATPARDPEPEPSE